MWLTLDSLRFRLSHILSVTIAHHVECDKHYYSPKEGFNENFNESKSNSL
jgi:hypothetical protein